MAGMIWNAAAVSRGLEEIGTIRWQLLLELKRLLDELNHWNRPTRYYDIIAGDWLEHFAHLTYAAMVEGQSTDNRQSLSQPIPVTADIHAYDSLRWRQSGLHEHLRAAVAHLLVGGTPAAWQFSADSAQITSGSREPRTEKAIRTLATKRPEALLVAPYFKCSRTEVATLLLGWRNWVALDNLRYPVNFVTELDAHWRLNQACAACPADDLLGVLRILLPLHLPVVLLEGFAAYRSAVLAMPVARPKAIYSANALHGHLTFKLLAAEWGQEGTRLLYHQHGGGYGLDRVHAFEQFESRVADRYYTWGWRSAGNQKIRTLSPAALHTPTRKKRYVLLSCVDFPVVVYRIHFHPMPGTIQTMQRETCEFLTALPDHRDLLVRPYSKDYSGNFVGMLRQAAPDADFDDRSASAFQRFAESRLVVHNYLGTAYLETLALNVPTVCFYDPDTYVFRAEAEPFMNALERVGILHRSGKAAARFVASLVTDPQAWWEQADVQEARSRFVENYANFATNWKRQWEREFRRAIDEPAALAD